MKVSLKLSERNVIPLAFCFSNVNISVINEIIYLINAVCFN